MTVSAKTLIQAKFAAASATAEYSVPTGKRTIVDKFTATNHDASARTLAIHLVPSGGSPAASNQVTKDVTISAGQTLEILDVKNHILEAGDAISVSASVASQVVIRASGREVS